MISSGTGSGLNRRRARAEYIASNRPISAMAVSSFDVADRSRQLMTHRQYPITIRHRGPARAAGANLAQHEYHSAHLTNTLANSFLLALRILRGGGCYGSLPEREREEGATLAHGAILQHRASHF